MKSNIVFYADDLHFLGKTEKERSFDLCVHGRATLSINGKIFANGIECCLSASALRFLRTLHRDHNVGNEEFLFPCCGNMLIPSEDGKTVTVIGCPNGVEFPIVHFGNSVGIGNPEDQTLMLYDEYKGAVKAYAKQIFSFIESTPRRSFVSDFENDGYKAFIYEYTSLLNENNI